MKFPTLQELAKDRLLGIVLNALPPEFLAEADEQGDPWAFLLKHSARLELPRSFTQFFRAAKSQRDAFVRLGEAARSGGSITSSFRRDMLKARKAGKRKAAAQAGRKVVGAICRSDQGRRWLLREQLPAYRIAFKAIYDDLYDRDVRRLGRAKAHKKWTDDGPFDLKRQSVGEKVSLELAEGWLRGNVDGCPPYCFCSDEVLATVAGRRLNLLSLTEKTLRTFRERIGLKKASIFFSSLGPVRKGQQMLLDRSGNVDWGPLAV